MRLKVCGITRLEDALLAAELGAWALGFVFYENSPRYISPEEAALISEQLPSELLTVGVMVNASSEDLEKLADLKFLSHVQLHGEMPDQIPLPFIQAFHPSPGEFLEGENDDAFAYLVDAWSEQAVGGSGRRANWEAARELKQRGKVILAGGLGPDNIAAALEGVNPYAIDLSSSIEESPGIKSAKKMRALFEVSHG